MNWITIWPPPDAFIVHRGQVNDAGSDDADVGDDDNDECGAVHLQHKFG